MGQTLVLHLGLCGPHVVQEQQRQLYSLLGTLQKASRCRNAAGLVQELCWGQEAAAGCCWAAAHAACSLLQAALERGVNSGVLADAAPAGDQQGQAAGAAVVQQPEVEYLPSLVICGRCLLGWAEQLQEQGLEVQQLLAAGAALQEDEEGGVTAAHSAARVCIPGWWEKDAAATPPPCRLECLVGTLSAWVDGVSSPAARAALAAAGGGELQQFRQQLQALSAAQLVLREDRNDSTLTALVQQLQATGVMLTGIAVPHFCNNPACGHLSGPTDVQLVSGRSCVTMARRACFTKAHIFVTRRETKDARSVTPWQPW